MRRHGEYAAVLLLDLLGAAGALLVALRTWQVITTPRPQRADVLAVSGRTVDPSSTALALVALAGVVAVLATRGWTRRGVGVVLALGGAGLVWRAFAAGRAVGVARARAVVAERHPTVGVDTQVLPTIAVHGVWPVLSAVCGVLVALAGLAVATRGQRWQGMSSRYDAPAAAVPDPDDDGVRQARAAASLWRALDRGEDPTQL